MICSRFAVRSPTPILQTPAHSAAHRAAATVNPIRLLPPQVRPGEFLVVHERGAASD